MAVAILRGRGIPMWRISVCNVVKVIILILIESIALAAAAQAGITHAWRLLQLIEDH